MSRTLAIITFLLSRIAVGSAVCYANVWSGFLVDLFCWNMTGHVAVDGAPLETAPKNHTVGCALLPNCIQGGYGLLVLNASSSKYQLAYTFDAATNALAVKYLFALRAASVVNNIQVNVCGTLTGGTIVASWIADNSGASTTTGYTGFLVDVFCWNMAGHVAVDGALLAAAPVNHTVGCLLLPNCIQGGYGLLMQDPSSMAYNLAYTFDDATNSLAVQYLNTLKAAGVTKNVQVRIIGAENNNKIVAASLIADNSGATSVAVAATTTMTTTVKYASGAQARSHLLVGLAIAACFAV